MLMRAHAARGLLLFTLLLISLLFSLQLQDAHAQVIADRYVAVGGDDATNDCTVEANPCATIANAISQAAPGDTISVGAGTFTENITVSQDVTITGAGEGVTIVDGNDADRVFKVGDGTTVVIQGLTIQNGTAADQGGGIYNDGTLTLTNATVSGNDASSVGGGIFNIDTMTMTNVTVSNNTAFEGGGIQNDGTLTMTDVTVSGNTAISHGGGIINNGGTLNMTSGALTNNTADSDDNSSGDGGGLYNANGAGSTISGVTITGNADANGLAVVNDNGTVTTTGNWWGDASGPLQATTNSAATGDAAGSNVTYSPWLGATPGTTPMTFGLNTTGTLQGAIDSAAAGDTISVGAGTFTENVTVSKNLTITGAGQGVTIVDGNDTGRVFTINTGVTVTMQDLTAQNGAFSGNGGGIYNDGALTLTDVTVDDNVSSNSNGGGIYNANGTLTLTDVTVSNNQTYSSGGGIYNDNGTVTMTGGALTDNHTVFNSGGGLYNDFGAVSTLSGVSITGNQDSHTPDIAVYWVGGTVTATGNWWGNAAGPAHASNTFNVSSQVQGVHDGVSFVPWLDDVPATGQLFAPVTNTTAEPDTLFPSIGAAITAASADDSLTLATGTFTENVTVSKDLTITGAGAGSTIVDGNDAGRVFTVNSGVTATIQGLTIQNGTASSGAGINNNGTLTLANAAVSGNIANTYGGGINNFGTLTMTDVTVSNNTANTHGGGINNFYTLTMTGGAFTNNTADFDDDTIGRGGALYDDGFGTTISGVSITGNTDENGLAVYRNSGTVIATGNWWGSATGPGGTGSGTGSGDGVNDGVSIAPWLDAAPPAGQPVPYVTNTTKTLDYDSIQDAIDGADAGNALTVSAGTFTENVTVSKDLTITGAGQGVTIVDGGAGPRVFLVNTGITATIEDLTIQNGDAGVGDGGGINNLGTLTLTDVAVSGNAASSGGGIFNNSVLTMTGGALTGNTATADGGGLYNTGAATLSGVSITGNDDVIGIAVVNQGGTLTATGNWWGNAAGPTASSNKFNVSSQGDGVGSGVSFTPWLDDVPGTGQSFAPVTNTTADPDTYFPSISAAITAASADDSLTLATGTFSENVTVSKDLTITGAGEGVTIVDGGDADSVFTVDNAFITAAIQDLTIQNGDAAIGDGGGIYNNGALALTDVTVRNSHAGSGRGIYNTGVITLTGSTVSGNIAASGGGIYHASGTLTLTSSTVSGNGAGGDGGGIYNSGALLTLTGSTVSSNTAANGGGIVNSNSDLTLTSSIISGNSATGHGGGIYNISSGDTEMTGGALTGNIADSDSGGGGNGGAVYVDSGSVTLSGVSITGNTDANDPDIALYMVGDTVTATGNWWGSATGPGGTGSGTGSGDGVNAGVSIAPWLDAAPPTGQSVPYVNNTTQGLYYALIQDAVDNANSGDALTLSADTFTENVTVDENVTITGAGEDETIVDGDDADTVLTINTGVTATIQDLTIQNGNAGSGSGGGIDNKGTLTLADVTVNGNDAATAGGGILNGGTLTMTVVTVSNNTAGVIGGGISNGGTLTMTDATVSGNDAATAGGIYNFNAALTIITSTVSGNSASANGGGIFNLFGGTLTMTGGALTDNTASGDGGALYNLDDAASANLSGVSITGNDDANGLAVVEDGSTVTATNNWWGSATGPGGDGPGSGDGVGGAGVDASAWLTRTPEQVAAADAGYLGTSIDLAAGWQTFSLPIAAENASLFGTEETVCTGADGSFAGIMPCGPGETQTHRRAGLIDPADADIALRFNATTQIWEQVFPGDTLEPGEAVLVLLNKPTTAILNADVQVADSDQQLHEGWNFVGIAANPFTGTDVAADTALASVYSPGGQTGYTAVVSPAQNAATFTWERDEASPPTLLRWRGYWVYMDNAGTLTGSSDTPLSSPLP